MLEVAALITSHPFLCSTFLFVCFTAFDSLTTHRAQLSIFRGNMLFLMPGFRTAYEYISPPGALGFWSLAYCSILAVFLIDFLQRLVLDPSGMFEAVTSLFTVGYLINVKEAKAALKAQKRRLRKELRDVFKD